MFSIYFMLPWVKYCHYAKLMATIWPFYRLQQSCTRNPRFRSTGYLGDRIKILMSWLPDFGSDVEIPLNKGQEDFGDGPSAKCRRWIRTVDLERNIFCSRKYISFARARTAQYSGAQASLHGTECSMDTVNSLRIYVQTFSCPITEITT
jgi:hypothetical protein